MGLSWVKVAQDQEISSEQESKLSFRMMSKTGAEGWSSAGFDTVIVVPSEWYWTPTDGYTEPEVTDRSFNADENGVFWMEAEKSVYDSDGLSISANPEASGGQILQHTENGTANNSEYKMSFEFNVEQPQNYDIWVLANLPGCHQASQMKFSLNNSEQETIWKSMPSSGYFPYNGPSDGTIDGGLNHLESVMKNKVYSAPALGTQFPLCWYKLSGSQYLSEGKNNAEISVVKASEHFVAFVDCVAAVPSSMNWIPGGNIEYPEPGLKNYAWIECENSNETSAVFEKRNYEAGSVKALYAEGVGVQNEVLSYDFTVDADTQYDIWILGTQLDKTYLTRAFMDIDNSDIPLEEEYQFSVDGDTKSDPIYKVNDDWGEVFWQKNVRPKTISAGKHTLYINFCERQLSGGKQYGVFDAIVIVPASWGWEPEKGTVLEDNTLLDAYAADNYMFSKYGSGVKDNIVFPEGVAPGGSTLNLNRRTKML